MMPLMGFIRSSRCQGQNSTLTADILRGMHIHAACVQETFLLKNLIDSCLAPKSAKFVRTQVTWLTFQAIVMAQPAVSGAQHAEDVVTGFAI